MIHHVIRPSSGLVLQLVLTSSWFVFILQFSSKYYWLNNLEQIKIEMDKGSYAGLKGDV